MDLKKDLNSFVRIGIHIVFWVFAWLFFIFYYKRYSAVNNYTLIASFVNLLVAMVTVYTFNYYLIPRFLLKNRIKKFVIFSILALIAFVYLQLMLTVILLINLLYTEKTLFPNMVDVVMLFLNILFIVFIAIAVKFYKRWTEKEHHEQVAQKEKVEVELQMLKTQINPHFLFNTLNSIYVLALKNSELTAGTVLKLSDILDYILYKIDSPVISIASEIEIINNYIELEKIRYTDRVTVDFHNHLESKNIQIPPMLIIPFIENAFKHGVAKSMQKSWIKIEIKEYDKHLFIDVANNKGEAEAVKKVGGIGLSNVTKRLNLLFHDNYTLDVIETNNRFEVKLQIPIS